MKTLSNSELTIKISPNGAELCSIYCHGHEYLWQADPAYWKRHSPVLFPIVGSVWNGRYCHEGHVYPLSQHGFARDMDFQLLSESSTEVHYRLRDSTETREKYPFPFLLDIGYHIHGRSIEVLWKVSNPGDAPLHFQIGAHPAFYFPGYDAAVPERGYFSFGQAKNLDYILISEKGCADVEHAYPLKLDESGHLPLDVYTFDHDALILEDNQVQEVVLHDSKRRPWLCLRFNAPVVGLWSPPSKNAPFVCIEPWYGRCDRAHYEGEYKDKDWMQHLAPHETFNGGYTIDIY